MNNYYRQHKLRTAIVEVIDKISIFNLVNIATAIAVIETICKVIIT